MGWVEKLQKILKVEFDKEYVNVLMDKRNISEYHAAMTAIKSIERITFLLAVQELFRNMSFWEILKWLLFKQ